MKAELSFSGCNCGCTEGETRIVYGDTKEELIRRSASFFMENRTSHTNPFHKVSMGALWSEDYPCVKEGRCDYNDRGGDCEMYGGCDEEECIKHQSITKEEEEEYRNSVRELANKWIEIEERAKEVQLEIDKWEMDIKNHGLRIRDINRAAKLLGVEIPPDKQKVIDEHNVEIAQHQEEIDELKDVKATILREKEKT